MTSNTFWKRSSDGDEEPSTHSTHSHEAADPDLENRIHASDSTLPEQRPHVDPALEKRVVRKLDMHLMPLVMALCKQLTPYQ